MTQCGSPAGQHNDARMNLAVVLTAAREGADIANHVEVLSLINEGGVVRGAHVRDTLTGNEWDIMAKVVVNATGRPAHSPQTCSAIRKVSHPAQCTSTPLTVSDVML